MELEIANGLIAAARAEAERTGEVLTFAVMDEGGNMVAFARMDGAGLASIETAIGKAYTSVATGAPTAELFPLVQPGGPLFGFGTSVASPRPLVPMSGGMPLRSDGRLVGAIGVAGGRGETDHQVSLVAAESAGFSA